MGSYRGVDMSTYSCVPAALDFRSQICGGQAAIRKHCFDLARRGGARVAAILGTEVTDNTTHTMSQCCFTMVRLPLAFAACHSNAKEFKSQHPVLLSSEKGSEIVKSIIHKLITCTTPAYRAGLFGLGRQNSSGVQTSVSSKVSQQVRDDDAGSLVVAVL